MKSQFMTFYLQTIGYRLKDVEIRAGFQRIYKRTLDTKLSEFHNEICNTYDGPAENSERVTVSCARPITAKYCSLQYGTKEEKKGTIHLYEVFFRGIGN